MKLLTNVNQGKHSPFFKEPIKIKAQKWYLAWQQINESKECGDYGEKGQIQITTEDQVRFFFKKFENRKNGTTCDWGQIPEVLYKK